MDLYSMNKWLMRNLANHLTNIFKELILLGPLRSWFPKTNFYFHTRIRQVFDGEYFPPQTSACSMVIITIISRNKRWFEWAYFRKHKFLWTYEWCIAMYLIKQKPLSHWEDLHLRPFIPKAIISFIHQSFNIFYTKKKIKITIVI